MEPLKLPENKGKKVVIAMSGGVDSSVAAVLLVRAGYDVTGMMMRLWSETGCEGSNRCCTPDAVMLANRVADKIGIPFYVIDAKEKFRNTVVEYFLEGYSRGITPNPCLECNVKLRWGFLLNYAREFGADYLSTGHYARLAQDSQGRTILKQGIDPHKDQSYVLSRLNQDQLGHSNFPLGDFYKYQIRDYAREMGLPVAERPDSQDLCFLGDRDITDFLKTYAPSVSRPGLIQNREGKPLGEHPGLAFYTIGQRKGLGIESSVPMYVIEKDIAGNRLIVGTSDELGKTELSAESMNWIAGNPPESAFPAKIKIRYRADFANGVVTPVGDDKMTINFERPLRDITPGQLAVVYQDEICLGSGFIVS